jgi:hypothetical protein
MGRVTKDEFDRAQGGSYAPRPKGKIPWAPERDATISEMREWLSNAIGLPGGVRVETVFRAGRDAEDPLTIVLSNGTKMRSSRQKTLQQARTLQAFLASESDGVAQPCYLSPAEVGDVYTVLCRLGTAAAKVDAVADLRERLAGFLSRSEELFGSLGYEARYATIEAARMRPLFDRLAALNGSDSRPVVVVDQESNARYIRASEWVAYLRFTVGHTVNESRLVAQMSEIGSERVEPQAWNADRSHKTHLVFYSVPEDL